MSFNQRIYQDFGKLFLSIHRVGPLPILKIMSILSNFFLAELYAHQDQNELALKYVNTAAALFEEMQIQYWPVKAKKLRAKLKF